MDIKALAREKKFGAIRLMKAVTEDTPVEQYKIDL
jgi:hypothetical protein